MTIRKDVISGTKVVQIKDVMFQNLTWDGK